MKWNSVTRRQFLQGSGGFLLSLPLLPSLLAPSEAKAASCLGVQPRFVGIFSVLGNVKRSNWYPDPARMNLTQSQLFPGHIIRSGNLPASISPVFGPLFDSIRGKLTFLEGIDWLQRLGHMNGGMLGCSARSGDTGNPDCPTIDQVLANHLYSSPTTNPVLVTGNDNGSCSFRVLPDGTLQNVNGVDSARTLFDQVFGGYSGSASNPLVVDRVLSDYQSTLANPRIGQEDAQTLQGVMDHLHELQTKINATQSCSTPVAQPPYIQTWLNTGNLIADWNLQADVIVAAFRCCVSRVATLTLNRYVWPSWTDWHALSHDSSNPEAQATIGSIFKFHADNLFYPLINKMDQIIETNGKTMLDNSLVQWGMEIAQTGDHALVNNCVAMAGSAAGAFRTGIYVDYRNHTSPYGFGTDADGNPVKLGIAYPWLLMSILRGFGLTVQQARSHLPQHSVYGLPGYGAWGPYGDYDPYANYTDAHGNPVTSQHTLFNQFYRLNLANDALPGFSI